MTAKTIQYGFGFSYSDIYRPPPPIDFNEKILSALQSKTILRTAIKEFSELISATIQALFYNTIPSILLIVAFQHIISIVTTNY